MKLTITHQDSYSRGELLLRTIFGGIYILIPHAFVMFFVNIYTMIISFLAWWAVLFTGKYPKGFFETMVKASSWSLRLYAAVWNLADGYPAIGLNGTSDKAKLDVPYPEKLSRGLLILRSIFGVFYLIIPHVFCLSFRMIWGNILQFLSWWAILFTGKYPANWHAFAVGTLRWNMRLGLYMSYMTDDYPPFSGKE